MSHLATAGKAAALCGESAAIEFLKEGWTKDTAEATGEWMGFEHLEGAVSQCFTYSKLDRTVVEIRR